MSGQEAGGTIREVVSLFRRLRSDEDGAVAVLVAIAMTAMIAVIALAIDVGNLAYQQRRLQATTDAAALAAALDINCSTCTAGTAAATAATYSAQSGDLNYQSGLNVTSFSATPYCDTARRAPSSATDRTAPMPFWCSKRRQCRSFSLRGWACLR